MPTEILLLLVVVVALVVVVLAFFGLLALIVYIVPDKETAKSAIMGATEVTKEALKAIKKKK